MTLSWSLCLRNYIKSLVTAGNFWSLSSMIDSGQDTPCISNVTYVESWFKCGHTKATFLWNSVDGLLLDKILTEAKDANVWTALYLFSFGMHPWFSCILLFYFGTSWAYLSAYYACADLAPHGSSSQILPSGGMEGSEVHGGCIPKTRVRTSVGHSESYGVSTQLLQNSSGHD